MKRTLLFTDQWNEYLTNFQEDRYDIYFTEEYVKLYKGEKDKVECFIYKDGYEILIFPYIKREITLLNGEYFDIEVPYGYGGPITNTDNLLFIQNAFSEFRTAAKESKIIVGFIRFHPLLQNHRALLEQCSVIFERKTVAINLELERDEIWYDQFQSGNRRAIRKAQKSGLVYYVDDSLQYLDAFKHIYRGTMERVNAENFYFFNDAYFFNIRRLTDYVFLGIVFFEEKVIAASLFFQYGIFGHYHLGGSLESERQYRPNNFLMYNTALYMKENGVKRFHLGGGTDRDINNNLYRFKKGFSKDEYSFYIGKLLTDRKMYEEVCALWEDKFPQKKEHYKNFVLKYRY